MEIIEKIRKEIERLEKAAHSSALGCADSETRKFHEGKDCAYQHIGVLIDSLQQEQPEEPDKSLEAEIQWYLREKCSGDDEPTVSEIARYFVKWQYQKDRGEFAKIRAKIWCEGFDAHKEQMLKNAVEASVNTYELTPGGSAYVEFVADMPVAHFRSNDKVRIVVLKDEEK